MEERISKEYFDWLTNLVCGRRYSKHVSYGKLLAHLHARVFVWLLPMDENRAMDGEAMRRRFATARERKYDKNFVMDVLDRPCSILEMMVALSLNCEEDIMDDPHIGDRTGQWFWGMIVSLGLGSMLDDRYDSEVVDEILCTFINRQYEPDGRGGLFTIKNCEKDLRDMEIWHQLCWYLDSVYMVNGGRNDI